MNITSALSKPILDAKLEQFINKKFTKWERKSVEKYKWCCGMDWKLDFDNIDAVCIYVTLNAKSEYMSSDNFSKIMNDIDKIQSKMITRLYKFFAPDVSWISVHIKYI